MLKKFLNDQESNKLSKEEMKAINGGNFDPDRECIPVYCTTSFQCARLNPACNTCLEGVCAYVE
ncbi:hypothetical protein [Neptunitalea lumnitzerae]|uniref:Uncharacterized protein n=1 Tax=Neptunitalea lumnitzerae TaxID=2965509 RepID=A0ABQ5MGU0_9FLAO|nr:hypothetical protein [Neptunitalea sp. Y10]GLB48610.1 hypothetical protein Y10_09780 [Neptunitalea sp. Y10]